MRAFIFLIAIAALLPSFYAYPSATSINQLYSDLFGLDVDVLANVGATYDQESGTVHLYTITAEDSAPLERLTATLQEVGERFVIETPLRPEQARAFETFEWSMVVALLSMPATDVADVPVLVELSVMKSAEYGIDLTSLVFVSAADTVDEANRLLRGYIAGSNEDVVTDLSSGGDDDETHLMQELMQASDADCLIACDSSRACQTTRNAEKQECRNEQDRCYAPCLDTWIDTIAACASSGPGALICAPILIALVETCNSDCRNALVGSCLQPADRKFRGCILGCYEDCDTGLPIPPRAACYVLGGIYNGGTSCCAASCGTCGGSGCSQRPGGAAGCCQGTVSTSSRICGTGGAPPCRIGNDACGAYGGVLSGNSVCCAASCGTCGGTGCSQRPGGAASCCTGHLGSAPLCGGSNATWAPCRLN